MYNRKDSYFEKAKGEGYRSRAAYKLLDINQKFRIIKRGDRVLDLGAAPGSWTQVCVKLGAKVLAIDLQPISELAGAELYVGDLTTENTLKRITGRFDAVLSDMAPSTSGIRKLDQGRSEILARTAFEIAKRFLKASGNFVVKVLEGPETDKLFADMKKAFMQAKKYRPPATRSESKEVYLLGMGLRSGD